MAILQIKFLRAGARVPEYATAGAACFDLRACFDDPNQAQHIAPGTRRLIGTGLAVAFPEGWVLEVLSRSGLALKAGVSVANAPGQVDSDYRGEVGVILRNDGEETFVVRHGDRIAQGRMIQVPRCGFSLVNDLPETVRAAGGFGSTGS